MSDHERQEGGHPDGPMRFWGLALVLAEIAQRLERERQRGESGGPDRTGASDIQKWSR